MNKTEDDPPECQHDERSWVNKKIETTDFDYKIRIKTKCQECGVIGYEVYDYSTFWIEEKGE
jgi:hypothetical protein